MKLFEIKHLGEDTIKRLERLLRNKLGKLYRFGGETGVQVDARGDIGYLYFFGKRAFRFDYFKSDQRFAYIDIWDDAAKAVAEKAPDYQVELPVDVSIFRILSQLVKIIKHPKAGEQPVKLEEGIASSKTAIEDEIDQILAEAERVERDEFVSIAKAWAKRTGKKDLVFTYPELRAAADAADVRIPGTFYDNDLVGDKSVSKYDLGRIEQDSSGKIISVRPAGASGTHHFNYTVDNPLSKKDERELQAAIEEEVSAEELFDHLERLVRMIVKGARPSLVVIGGPGTGKTKTITDVVNQVGLQKGKEWVMVKGKAAPLALYSTLFLNNGKLVLFDDTDSVWGNEDSVNILKAALDSSPVRTVSWASTATQAVTHMTDDEKADYAASVFASLQNDPAAKVKLPSEFDFTGRIIFISNMARKDLDSAVLNRSMFIDMTLTPEQVFDRIEGIMDKLSAPNSMELRPETKREVFDHLREQVGSGKLKYVSIRTFIGALGVASSGDPEWRKLLKYMGSD